MERRDNHPKELSPEPPKDETRGRASLSPQAGIVIPCYNESRNLKPALFVSFVRKYPGIHLRFVNDRSTDDTQQKIEEIAGLAEGNITLQSLAENRGKGEAVRAGIRALLDFPRYVYVGYWDADLATPLEEIPRFIDVLEMDSEVYFVCGSRIKRMGARIDRFWYRHYFGRFFATAASLVLDLPFYDTQCGAKLIRRELAERIFNRPFISRWLFDIELIARVVELLGKPTAMKALFELPLEKWQDRGGSKVRLSYLPKLPLDLCRIRLAYRKSLSRKR